MRGKFYFLKFLGNNALDSKSIHLVDDIDAVSVMACLAEGKNLSFKSYDVNDLKATPTQVFVRYDNVVKIVELKEEKGHESLSGKN